MDYTKYNLVNNKDWLYEQYITLKKSAKQIAKEVGYKSSNSIRQSLIRNNIPIRSYSSAQRINHIDNIKIDIEVLDGTLLGDGYLSGRKKSNSDICPSFNKKNKFLDHVEYIRDILLPNVEIKTGYRFLKKTGKEYVSHMVYSNRTEKLIPFYDRWYPEWNNFKKVVPEDITITPTVLLHWFLDDGSTTYCGNKKNPMIIFCSESFTEEENQLLCDKINQSFDLGAKLAPCNSGTKWRVRIPQNRCNDFFNIIGKCPVPSLKYKWKLSKI